MRHLLLLLPALDANDPVLGFALGWTNALARHAARISVVSLRVGAIAALAPNVSAQAVGGGPRVLSTARLLGALAAMPRPDVALAAMNWPLPLAALPALRARRIPLALWWAHGAAPAGLRLLLPFVARVLTSTEAAFPVATPKCRAVGQGIDTEAFAPAAQDPPCPFTVITVGRVAPVKRLHLLAEACGLAGLALRSIGPGTLPSLETLPPVKHAGLPALLRGAHCFATASATGSPDKAALEAMACGLPVVALGEGLRQALPAHLAAQVIVPDVPAMAARLAALAAMAPDQRRGFGQALRDAVRARHDRVGQVGRIAAELAAIAR